MSIFKETFKDGVKKQLKARQEAIVERTPSAIQYFNSRNAWIRMTSAVDVGGSGSELARSYVLLGGTLLNGKLRSGISTSGAYSVNSPGGNTHRLGIRPMPGITNIDVKSKSAYGSLREIVVNFYAWDLRQLEELEILYMRPGYSVMVEWGWAPYLDNGKKLSNDVQFVDDVLDGGPITKEQIWDKIYNKSAQDGNYDAIYGFVKNYSWSARADGGYDCSTTLITMGEILESLKVNYGPFVNKPPTESIFGKLNASYFGKNEITSKAYNQNIIAGICSELYLTLFDIEKIGNNEDKVFNGWNFYRFDITIEGKDKGNTITSKGAQIYITLKSFVDVLNKHVLLADKKAQKPVLELSVFCGKHNGGITTPLTCLGDIQQLSTDPSICQIKNTNWVDPKTNLGIDISGPDLATLKKIMETLSQDYWYDGFDKTQLGIIGNIYVNLDYIYSLVTNPSVEAQDKKEKNDVSLFDFIRNMMAGINTSIGNVANFGLFLDPVDSIARIIDVNYTGNRTEDWEKAVIIELQKLGSVVRSYKLESQIFPEQSTIIAIGAQAQGGALGEDVNTLVDFNQNLIDRIIPIKESPLSKAEPKSAEDIKKENEEKEKIRKENLSVLIDYISKIDADFWESKGDFDPGEGSKYSNALKDQINYYRSNTNTDNKNRAIIPTKLSLEMDGIGGIIIGNLFRIPDEILPRGYKGGGGVGPAKIAYAVTGIGHSIQNNDWVTRLDAQFIILDEPRGGISTADAKAIKAGNKAASSSSSSSGGSSNTGTSADGSSNTGTRESSKPRKTANCSKSIQVITQANAPGVNIPDRIPWATIKNQFPIVNGSIKALSVGTPLDGSNDFAYKMRSRKVASAPDRKINYIVLHYTVSNLTDPLFHYKNTWEVGEASSDFVIGRTGKIAGFKNFRNLRAWHYGSATWGGDINKESIGFEIESFGPIIYCQSTNKFINAYNQEMDKSEVALTPTYRGYNMWHALSNVQVSAIANLILALYNSGAISDKVQFVSGMKATGRYGILFPETGLTVKPAPGIITHGSGRQPSGKIDTFPQGNLRQMLDDLPNLVSTYTKTNINWVAQ
jgi:hypothetical protein